MSSRTITTTTTHNKTTHNSSTTSNTTQKNRNSSNRSINSNQSSNRSMFSVLSSSSRNYLNASNRVVNTSTRSNGIPSTPRTDSDSQVKSITFRNKAPSSTTSISSQRSTTTPKKDLHYSSLQRPTATPIRRSAVTNNNDRVSNSMATTTRQETRRRGSLSSTTSQNSRSRKSAIPYNIIERKKALQKEDDDNLSHNSNSTNKTTNKSIISNNRSVLTSSSQRNGMINDIIIKNKNMDDATSAITFSSYKQRDDASAITFGSAMSKRSANSQMRRSSCYNDVYSTTNNTTSKSVASSAPNKGSPLYSTVYDYTKGKTSDDDSSSDESCSDDSSQAAVFFKKSKEKNMDDIPISISQTKKSNSYSYDDDAATQLSFFSSATSSIRKRFARDTTGDEDATQYTSITNRTNESKRSSFSRRGSITFRLGDAMSAITGLFRKNQEDKEEEPPTLKDVAEHVTKNEQLWNEFKAELARNNVVTQHASLLILNNYVKTRLDGTTIVTDCGDDSSEKEKIVNYKKLQDGCVRRYSDSDACFMEKKIDNDSTEFILNAVLKHDSDGEDSDTATIGFKSTTKSKGTRRHSWFGAAEDTESSDYITGSHHSRRRSYDMGQFHTDLLEKEEEKKTMETKRHPSTISLHACDDIFIPDDDATIASVLLRRKVY